MTYMSKPEANSFDGWTPEPFNWEQDLLSEDKLLSGMGMGYLVPGFLPEQGMTVAWGPPKDGAKTAFWLRLARRISQGLTVFGRATNDGITPLMKTIYIATEGKSGLRDRVEALRSIEGPAPNFYLITKPLNLLDMHDIEQMVFAAGEDTLLIVIDTLGRMMGSAGADENGSDMARIIGNLDLLRHEVQAQLVLVHHGSKNGGSGGPRGHGSLLGAADLVVEHGKLSDGSRTVTVTHARDQAPGLVLRYGLRTVELPAQDQWRPARTSLVAEELPERDKRAGGRPGAEYADLALEQLREATAAACGPVTVEAWRAAFYAAVPNLSPANRQKQFVRAKAGLVTTNGPVLILDGCAMPSSGGQR
jgi:hypothetical protein